LPEAGYRSPYDENCEIDPSSGIEEDRVDRLSYWMWLHGSLAVRRLEYGRRTGRTHRLNWRMRTGAAGISPDTTGNGKGVRHGYRPRRSKYGLHRRDGIHLPSSMPGVGDHSETTITPR
jgi:hypothetical protein